MRQERQHSELIHDVESFKPDQLKHADTKEKIILPNAKGIIEIYRFVGTLADPISLLWVIGVYSAALWCFEVTRTNAKRHTRQASYQGQTDTAKIHTFIHRFYIFYHIYKLI